MRIEEPEAENIFYISYNNIHRIRGQENKIKQSDEKVYGIAKSDLDSLLSQKELCKKKNEIKIDPISRRVIVNKNPIYVTYGKDEIDKYLNYTRSIELLGSFGLKLPSYYKDKSMEEFKKAFEKGIDEAAKLHKKIRNVAIYEKDTDLGISRAKPDKGASARPESRKNIDDYNIMQIFVSNMRQLRNYKKLTGIGIIHFNNPQQLLNRLELLAGSIFAGNNGVKQEFSQIAHLLHQLKVITKKQLDDLLKKYILNK